MKSVFRSVLCLLILVSTIFIPIQANDLSASEDATIMSYSFSEKDGFKMNKSAYTIPANVLVGTPHEGLSVTVKDDGVYLNDTKSSDQVQALINGVLVGWLADGVLYYVTGYTGAQIAAATISVLWSFVCAHPIGFILAVGALTTSASFVSYYRTSSGNECMRSAPGTFACKYSVYE